MSSSHLDVLGLYAVGRGLLLMVSIDSFSGRLELESGPAVNTCLLIILMSSLA